jgi:regulator of replication initiation timing
MEIFMRFNMDTEKLEQKIKDLKKQVEEKDEEILLLRAVLDALRNVLEERSTKKDKEKLKELESKLDNL